MSGNRALFWRVFRWRPLRAIGIAYWYLTRRRVRARNRLQQAAAASPFRYAALIRMMERPDEAAAAAREMAARWAERPLISVLVFAESETSATQVGDVVRALRDQIYDRWELVIAPTPTPTPAPAPGDGADDPRVRTLATPPSQTPLAAALAAARGGLAVPLAAGATLSPLALFRFAEAARAAPDATLLYGDEDKVDGRGHRSAPWFKPGWNREMLLALDYVSRVCAVRTPAARRLAAGRARALDLVLALTRDEAAEVVHVPHILAHMTSERPDTQDDRVVAVAAHLAPDGASAEAGPFGTVTVRWPAPSPEPSVTILVPTRDRVELVSACLGSLLAHTRYSTFRVVVVDNGSVEPATRRYLAEAVRDDRVSVLACDGPFNYAAINNDAAARTGGDYLCFLNNDTEIIAGDWLGEMMRYAVRPGIGAVGAKLLYEDRSIQHAGVVIGLGNAAGHAHRGLANTDPGYFAQAHVAHHASAVTGACLVVARAKFEAVGGFDAVDLQVAYNDVDLCLKLQQRGWRNVYAPQATLLHLESKSRALDRSPAEVARYHRELAVLQARWNTAVAVDPLHHPALDRSSETFRPSFLSRS